jgi:RING finger protein 113A
MDRKKKKNPLIQSTSQFSGVKLKQKNIAKEDEDVFPVATSFQSSRKAEPEGPRDMGATATLEIETEKDKDARAIFEKAQKINEELKDKDDDKVYRGLNNYKQFIQVKDTAQGNAASAAVRKGPIRAPENIRSTVRWDYQPNLCKDYKETGFCGFGDSCIFLHDRTDYKQGWQIELEMSKGTYGNDDDDDKKYEINDDEQLPFKCLMCRKSFNKPIVTKCKHYFCEKCALDHFRKSSRCFVCGTQTLGIFNPAKEIAKRIASNPNQEDDDEQSDHGSEVEEITHLSDGGDDDDSSVEEVDP